MRVEAAAAALVLSLVLAPAAFAQSDSVAARPIPDSSDDRLRSHGLFGPIAVGGYLEADGIWHREDGATTELGMALTRWNLLASTEMGGRVRVFSEIEFEEGGKEIVVEMAQVDLFLHPTFNPRGGVLLLPLGRFNLTHDGPRNELPRRPNHATDLIGVAIGQPGLGAYGRFGDPTERRVTYELYAVTGYNDGLFSNSPEGIRLPAGKFNPEDGNLSPAFVGRTEWASARKLAIGLSGYHGAWNVFKLDGLVVDERRDLAVAVLDTYVEALGFALAAEAAHVQVDLPSGLAGIFASRQGGLYVQLSRPFGRAWVAAMPESWFTAAARLDVVDFDRDLPGDSFRSVTLGINFRPIARSAFKLAWMRGESRDRFDNRAQAARVQLGLTSYF